MTYKSEPRGYYLSTRIETRTDRMVSFELFTGGMKSLLEEAKMFSAKRLANIEVDPELIKRLASQVLYDYRQRQIRQAEQRAQRRA